MFGEAGQEQCRLTRRVSPSHDGDLIALAHLGLYLGCAIIEADAFELIDVGDGQFSIPRARRDYDRATLDEPSIV